MANVVNPNIKASISINAEDELPFDELISSIDAAKEEVDILLVTPGGSAQQVDKFVNALRARFKVVSFILPNVAMSAGTIFIMSGDEIIMHARSFFGPIDPQVPNKDGVFVPAQTLRALIDDI
ncbi:MAG: SDH family Clp fold serine proteinase [Spirochaetia bacterium]